MQDTDSRTRMPFKTAMGNITSFRVDSWCKGGPSVFLFHVHFGIDFYPLPLGGCARKTGIFRKSLMEESDGAIVNLLNK